MLAMILLRAYRVTIGEGVQHFQKVIRLLVDDGKSRTFSCHFLTDGYTDLRYILLLLYILYVVHGFSAALYAKAF